jgi:O-antigen/teichoic acid export membrane protein
MNENQKHLMNIAKGSSTLFFGQIIGLLIQFAGGVIAIRYLTKTDFGLLSLVLTIVNILVVISSLGFNEGIPRILANYLAERDYEGAHGSICYSTIIVGLTSTLFCILLYFSSHWLEMLFHMQGLAYVAKWLCIMVPALALSNLMVSQFRGVKLSSPKVIFSYISPNILRLIGYVSAILMGFGFTGILVSQSLSVVLSFVFLIAFSLKKLKELIPQATNRNVSIHIFMFSFPLLGLAILNMLTGWTPTLLLGYYSTPEQVGSYNALMRLVHFIPVPLETMMFLYLPIATQLYNSNQMEGIRQLYSNVTKWTCLITLPVVAIMFMDTEFVIQTLFGEKYVFAAFELKVLTVGYFFHAFAGPNGMTLMAFGQPRQILFSTAPGVIASILLCFFLIPISGIKGAAFAVTLSILLSNIILSLLLYRRFKIHPFNRSNMVPQLISAAFMAAVIAVVRYFPCSGLWIRIPLYLGICIFALGSPFLTNSIDENDKTLIESIKKRFSFNPI